jgi:hypothetical protein
MSDLMFYGVLRMPYELAMSDELSRRQFYSRVQEAASRVEKAEARVAELEATLADARQPVEGGAQTAPRPAETPVVDGEKGGAQVARARQPAEAEPVGFINPQSLLNFKAGTSTHEWLWKNREDADVPVYTHPAPVEAAAGESDAEEDAWLIDRLSKLLAGVAVALRGPEAARHRHGYQDLPELAEKMALELAIFRERESAAAGVEREMARHQAIGKAVERACSELPPGFDVEIVLERDAGTVRLCVPDGFSSEEHFDADTFDEQINNAIDAAIRALTAAPAQDGQQRDGEG